MQNTAIGQGAQALPSAFISLVPGKRPGHFSVRVSGPFGFRFIGEIHGGTLHKQVRKEHLFKACNGIGFSAALILAPDISFLWIVTDLEGHGKLCTSRAFFRAHAVPVHIKNWEPQLVLPLSLWGKRESEQWEVQESRIRRMERERDAQGSLFGAA